MGAMRRAGLIALIPLLALAADGGSSTADGGAGLDAGQRPAPQRWRWTHADGGWLDDAGTTDVLVVPLGETARVQFPLPIVLMQCDAELLRLAATRDALLLTGTDAGHTSCGFWFFKQSWPHRYMDVTVPK
jgi:hypothetical protein